MSIFFGATPGRKGQFGVAALYFKDQLPASVLRLRAVACVDDALREIIAVAGEWSEMSAVGVAAPLSWDGSARGLRPCDHEILERLPTWAPRPWVRSAVALPGAVALQGPALAWALANEIKSGQLPKHAVFETLPRASLALLAPEHKSDLLLLSGRPTPAAHAKAVARLLARLTDSNIVRFDVPPPTTLFALEAVVSALIALAVTSPALGLVTRELDGGNLRPLGARPVVLLEALAPR